MDRRQAHAGLLIGAALALLAADRPASAPPLQELRWLAPGTMVEHLLRRPVECLTWPREPVARQSAEVGSIAFRAPLVLGGQAARAGLSCASCHVNGRDNPDFLFPGISGGPGTADITASLFSTHRGDGKFNPKPIPDLAREEHLRIVSRDPAYDDLERFIRGLIVEEFDGPEPPAAILSGLANYVRAMEPAEPSCGRYDPVTLGGALGEVETAVRLARLAAPRDEPTARILLGAARSALGRVDERFRQPGLDRHRLQLSLLSGALQSLQKSPKLAPAWDDWARQWRRSKAMLLRAESRSLYAERRLRRALASRD